ncbi:Signal peptidase complex subunit 2 [Kalmanozyma brasiliensis GHG001]|uniref:Signal peptidase complex subunit 2 n=1 Tax=Kalmanozyma brasiliensis (strain GHG001) TaxID=1365824 RepID=V5EAF5_KALBG|nr:Signal peptidase complex subunit 2 [Kalmanozyma brasiliensis GHG001]EST07381.1 Signal peptidase complex subunit 2 [Kalmanozyma brasiliensis GHG001]
MAKSEADKKVSNDRIVVDNSNLSELKATCDEAVERILSRRTEADASKTKSQAFVPFKVSHLHTDLRLILGFTASAIMIGTSLWAYFVEKEWKRNKQACGIAVVVYIILSGIQLADSYLQGNNIFIGTRKTVSNRIESEHLTIASPSLPKAVKKGSKTSDGKPILTPPAYTLKFDYTRKSNKGKSLLARKSGSLPLGHLGEWFTEEGEFVEHVFEQRLISGLEKAFGQ